MSALAPASSLGVVATLRRGVAVSPQLVVGWKVTFLLAVVASLGQGPRADRRPADGGHRDPGAGRSRRAPRRHADQRRRRRSARRRGLLRLRQRPALPVERERSALAAHAGVPARARPVGPHPEHRAPRLPGLPGDVRRRHDLAVRAVGRDHAARLGAADRRRDRPHGRLLLAAHPASSGPASSRCSSRCARCRSGSTAGTRSCASASARCSARSPRPSSAPRPSARTGSASGRSAGSTRPSGPPARRWSGRRTWSASCSPAASWWPTSCSPSSSSRAPTSAIAGEMSVGKLLAFLFLVQLFTGPVQMATEVLNELQNAVAGWRRVLGVLETPIEVVDAGADGVPSPRGPATLELRDVAYHYPDGPPVLRRRRRARARRVVGRGRRGDRVGQDDDRQARRPVHGPDGRRRAARRRGPARHPRGPAAPPDRAGAAGGLPVRRDAGREHRVRPAVRRRRGDGRRPTTHASARPSRRSGWRTGSTTWPPGSARRSASAASRCPRGSGSWSP